MRLRDRTLLAIIAPFLVFMIAATARAQQPASEGPQGFDRVSISLSVDSRRHHLDFDGEHLAVTNWSLRQIIQFAYGLPSVLQVQGGPEWVDSVRYDIHATGGRQNIGGAPDPNLQGQSVYGRPAVQALLRDQFGLTVHPESRQIAGFALVVAQDGPKLKLASGNARGKSGVFDGPIIGVLEGNSATLPMLANSLRQHVPAAIILDRTGLAGAYNFTLHWNYAPDSALPLGPPPYDQPSPARGETFQSQCQRGQLPGGCYLDSAVPALSLALQQQLGLQLRPEQFSLDSIVIDQVKRAEIR